MPTTLNRIITALILCGLSSVVLADEAAIRKTVAAKFPNMEIKSIKKTEYSGLYEVVVGDQILYSDKNASYIFVGHIFDPKTDQDLTDARLQKVNAVKFDALPFEDAIKIVRGNGKRKLAVFSDPDCPYCKRFEAELAKVTDVTVYLFLMPIDSLHPNAAAKSRAVWCAPDRAKAWEELMTKGIEPKNDGSCNNPVAKTGILAAKLGIRATPTGILADGRRVPGAVPAAQLEAMLGGEAAK